MLELIRFQLYQGTCYLHFSIRYSSGVNRNNNMWIVYILFTRFQKIKNNKVCTKYIHSVARLFTFLEKKSYSYVVPIQIFSFCSNRNSQGFDLGGGDDLLMRLAEA